MLLVTQKPKFGMWRSELGKPDDEYQQQDGANNIYPRKWREKDKRT
jgi:hypothetical protein